LPQRLNELFSKLPLETDLHVAVAIDKPLPGRFLCPLNDVGGLVGSLGIFEGDLVYVYAAAPFLLCGLKFCGMLVCG